MSMEPARAASLLKARLDELATITESGPAFKEWRERTETTIRAAMPSDNPSTLSKFNSVRVTPAATVGDPRSAYAGAFRRGLDSFAAILKAAIYDRELAIEPDKPGPFLGRSVIPQVEVVLSEFRRADEEGELDHLDKDDRVEAHSLVDALSSQTRSPRPNRGIVGAALDRLDQIMIAGLGALAGAGLQAAIHAASAAIH